jgi:hypothetical protein
MKKQTLIQFSMTLALTLFVGRAVAQELSVFGFSFNRPLALPECPYKIYGGSKSYQVLPPATCLQDARPLNGYGRPVRSISFGRGESPAMVKNFTAYPLEENGVLIGLHFLTPGLAAQDTVLTELTAKFGQPNGLSRQQAKTAFGAVFDTFSATWAAAPDISVSFVGVTTRIETGEVFIDSAEAKALRQSWVKAATSAERKL